MKKIITLFSLESIVFLLLVGCSSNQPKTEQNNVSESVAMHADSMTLLHYYFNFPIETLSQYDGEARDQILSDKKVNEDLGYLECHVVSELDNFTIKIQKINSDETVMVHSSGFMGGSEIPTDYFQVFQFMDSSWQTNKTALSKITLAQFYGTKEVPDADIYYAYELDPSSLELKVKLIKLDHYDPYLADADSAEQAYMKKLDSNEYSELVMNWDKAGHKFFLKERILNKPKL